MKRVEGVVPMPVDCETARFPACLASAYLRAEGIVDPIVAVYCPARGGDCVACGRCGNPNRLHKRQNAAYNHLAAASGHCFVQIDLTDDKHMAKSWDEASEEILGGFDDYVDFTMRFLGYRYDAAPDDEAIRRSLDADRPVLAKLKGAGWTLLTGYEGERFYGLDGSYGYWGGNAAADGYDGRYFYLDDARAKAERFLVLTERTTPGAGIQDVYARGLRILARTEGGYARSAARMEEDAYFEGMDMAALEDMRARLCRFIGQPIDMRPVLGWQASMPVERAIEGQRALPGARDVLGQVNGLCFSSHETLWIAWRAMGEYMPGERARYAEGLRNPVVRRVVRDVLEIVRDNDERIAVCLRALLEGKPAPAGL